MKSGQKEDKILFNMSLKIEVLEAVLVAKFLPPFCGMARSTLVWAASVTYKVELTTRHLGLETFNVHQKRTVCALLTSSTRTVPFTVVSEVGLLLLRIRHFVVAGFAIWYLTFLLEIINNSGSWGSRDIKRQGDQNA